jgi:hypothetical protein
LSCSCASPVSSAERIEAHDHRAVPPMHGTEQRQGRASRYCCSTSVSRPAPPSLALVPRRSCYSLLLLLRWTVCITVVLLAPACRRPDCILTNSMTSSMCSLRPFPPVLLYIIRVERCVCDQIRRCAHWFTVVVNNCISTALPSNCIDWSLTLASY